MGGEPYYKDLLIRISVRGTDVNILVIEDNRILYTKYYDVDGDKSEALALIVKKLVEVLG